MKIDIGALVDDPSISPTTQVEINFAELLRTIFGKEEKPEKNKSMLVNNLTYLN